MKSLPLSLLFQLNRKQFTGLLLVSLLLFGVSCQKANNNGEILNPNGFNIDKFEQNIKDRFGPSTLGFSYSIAVGNNIVRNGAMGVASMGSADGIAGYTIETRQELFSVTKFMTAIAAMKLLLNKGLTPDEPIVNYLPPSWNVHQSYNTLSFRQLLSHNSGFQMSDRGYDSLKLMMTLPQGNTARSYNNANFALCRILLPYLKFQGTPTLAQLQPNQIEEFVAIEFRKIMRDLVLKPSGLTYWDKADFKDWHHNDSPTWIPTRYYLFSNLNLGGDTNSDDVLIAGSRGLVLTTYEVAQVINAFENGKLLPAQITQMMKSAGCGFDGVGGFSGAKGKYYWKNGGGINGRGQGGESIIMIFPNSVRVSINTNSRINEDDQLVGAPSNIAKCYDDAW